MPSKKKDAPKSKSTKNEIQIHYPEDLSILYSNHAQMTISNLDVAIDFGIRNLQSSGEKITSTVIQINQRVMMSIQHAKLFSEKLSGLIKNYENDFGEILTEPKKKND